MKRTTGIMHRGYWIARTLQGGYLIFCKRGENWRRAHGTEYKRLSSAKAWADRNEHLLHGPAW